MLNGESSKRIRGSELFNSLPSTVFWCRQINSGKTSVGHIIWYYGVAGDEQVGSWLRKVGGPLRSLSVALLLVLRLFGWRTEEDWEALEVLAHFRGCGIQEA